MGDRYALNRLGGLLLVSILVSWLWIKESGAKDFPHEDAFVVPDHASVGEYGTWTFVYRAGGTGIQTGGGVRFRLPPSWFVFPWPLAKEIQMISPAQPHFVSVATSNTEANITLATSHYGLDGQYHRYGLTFVTHVEEHGLVAGDVISITFANTQAPTLAQTGLIEIATDAEGDGDFDLLADPPELKVAPGSPEKVRIMAPSQAVAGEPFAFLVTALDKYDNATGEFTATVAFASTDPAAILPPPSPFFESDDGHHAFTATLHTRGVQNLLLQGTSPTFSQTITGNPIQIAAMPLEMRVYWGDVHSHSKISHDGLGQAQDAYLYASQVSGLDFYALTDHAHADDGSEGITDQEWAEMQDLVTTFYEPGQFVTFLGNEWSGQAPYGHRNLIYRTPSGPLFWLREYPTILDLWQALADAELEALTIPHHTGIAWGVETNLFHGTRWPEGSPYVDWSYASETWQRVAEVYSLHGASEYFGNPLAYEDVEFVPGSASHSGPHYLRDGWAAGQRLGLTGSSDNHTSQPGLEHGGLTAVYAQALTRQAVFDAIRAGRTYATTGARILVDFQADGHWPGERYQSDRPPHFGVEVAGTANLDFVEIVKYDGSRYHTAYLLSQPGTAHVSFGFVDAELTTPSLYYARVKQENQIGGRDVMAWSSPIWITPTATYHHSFLPLIRGEGLLRLPPE